MTTQRSKPASRSSKRKPDELQPFEVETVRRSDIAPDERNPRQLDSYARKRLHSDLDRFKLVDPIIANRQTGRVVGGHQRLEWLDEQHPDEDYELKVAWVDLPDEEAVQLMIVLNNRAAMGDWNTLELERLVAELGVDPVKDLEFAPIDVEALMPGLSSFCELPDAVADDVGKIQEIKEVSRDKKREAKEKKQREADSETYVVVCFDDRPTKNRLLALLNLPDDERYVDGSLLLEAMGLDSHKEAAQPSATQ